MSSRYLFVYGTLRRGNMNQYAVLLHRSSNFTGEGSMRAELRHLDGFTGMIPDEASTNRVQGEVFEINNPDAVWPTLDAYEGEQFERRIVKVELVDGRAIDSWTYVYRG